MYFVGGWAAWFQGAYGVPWLFRLLQGAAMGGAGAAMLDGLFWAGAGLGWGGTGCGYRWSTWLVHVK